MIDNGGRVASTTVYRVTGASSATAETSATSYDADGNPIAVTDANGHTTTTTYDLLDRKQTRTVPRSATLSNDTSWTYDPSGDVTSQTSPSGLNLGDGTSGALVVDGTTAGNSTDGVAHGQSNPFQISGGARYTTVTLQNGGWVTAKAAYGLVFYATGTVTVCSGCGITMSGKGYTGGAGGAGGAGGLGNTAGTNGNVSGSNGGYAGGGSLLSPGGGGGGGGHNGAGTSGATPSGGGAGGAGGATSGTADFSDVGTNYVAAAGGGGGGGGQGLNGSPAGSGGSGGGFIHISAPTITVNGTIDVSGIAGGSGPGVNAGGGGGAAGGMWLSAVNINLASASVLNTSGGAGGASTGTGGTGGAGAPGYLRLEVDNVTNAPAGANRTRAGMTTAYSYDADHRVTDTIKGFQGATVADMTTAIPDSLGQTNERTRVGYDADGHKIIAFNPRAFTTAALLTSPNLGFSSRADYDADGRLIATYDPRYDTADPATADVSSGGDGGTTLDQQTSQCPTGVDPSVAPGYGIYPSTVGVCLTRTTYDADGNVARSYLPTSTGSDNRYLAKTYTDDDLLASVTGPDPTAADGGTARVTTATYLYDGDGRQISAADANGNTATTKYTGDGLTAETDGQAYGSVTHVVKYGHNANGQQTTGTAPDAAAPASGYVSADYTTTTSWTSDGLKSKISAPGNATGAAGLHVMSYAYDAVGNPLTVKSPSANAADATNPSGLASQNSYTFDNLVASTATPITGGSSPSYRVTVYGYTPSGQKASTDVGTCLSGTVSNCVPGNAAWTDGGTLRYTYAPDGVNVSQIGRNNATITTTYDQAGDPIKIASTDSSVIVTGSYYLDGLPRTASDGANTNTYAFDASGLPSLRTDQTGSSGFTAGSLLKTSYGYDDAGLPKVGISNITGASTSWGYDQAGRPTARTDTGGSNNRVVSQAFNPDNTVKSLTVTAGGSAVASDSYGYDNNGNITSDAVATGSTSYTNGYGYNPAGNVTSWTQSGSLAANVTYGWDHNSNRISVTSGGTTATATYNADNSLAATNSGGVGALTVTSTYSPAGELTQTAVSGSACTTTVYDDFNRTASQTQNANLICGTSQKSATTYAYDGLDRIQNVGTTPPSGSGTAAYTTHSSYDGFTSQLVGQIGAATGATNNPGSTVTTAYQLNPNGVAVAYSQTPAGGGTASPSWLNKNAQGSVTSVLGVGGTSLSCGVNYDPFGDPKLVTAPTSGNGICTQATSTANTLWFHAEPRDPSYGTYQLGSRTYNPVTASFSTPDTYRTGTPAQDLSVGTDPLTQNTYTYVNGNPVNLGDPSGHRAICMNGDEQGCGQEIARASTAIAPYANPRDAWALVSKLENDLYEQHQSSMTFGPHAYPWRFCGNTYHIGQAQAGGPLGPQHTANVCAIVPAGDALQVTSGFSTEEGYLGALLDQGAYDLFKTSKDVLTAEPARLARNPYAHMVLVSARGGINLTEMAQMSLGLEYQTANMDQGGFGASPDPSKVLGEAAAKARPDSAEGVSTLDWVGLGLGALSMLATDGATSLGEGSVGARVLSILGWGSGVAGATIDGYDCVDKGWDVSTCVSAGLGLASTTASGLSLYLRGAGRTASAAREAEMLDRVANPMGSLSFGIDTYNAATSVAAEYRVGLQ